MPRLTLDQFVERAPAAIEAFAAATRAAQAEGDEGFIGPQFEQRTEPDWWREVAAYFEFTEVQEMIAADRRNDPIERRRHSR